MSQPDLPAWFGEQGDKRRQNRRSRAQERKRAAETGGKVQRGSGTSWRARGDVRREEDLEQLKFTDAASYRVSVKEWQAIVADAQSQGREPVLIIDFEQHGLRLRVTQEDH